MSARDELAELLGDKVPYHYEGSNAENLDIADAILEAGWRPPAQQITTDAELDALPGEVLVLTEQGGYWESIKRMDGLNWWKEPGARDVRPSTDLTLPATVIHNPQENEA